jgi:hypothetical protein
MVRGCLACTVVLMFLAPAALADLGMAQDYSLYAPNIVSRSGPQSSATGGNTVTVRQNQLATGVLGGVVTQQQTGTLNQDAATTGQGDGSGTTQQAEVGGLQGQRVANLLGVVVGLPQGPTIDRPILSRSMTELFASILNR